MRIEFFQPLLILFLAIIVTLRANAQQVNEPMAKAEWSAPNLPFRIVGNLYYVGTQDLACYLITTNDGNILINTGLAASANQIKKNIESLGFKWMDIKILLTSQAHYDHVGAMAEIKKATGALLMVNEKDAPVLETGGASDYELGKYGVSFQPVKPDRLLHDGDTITLGAMDLIMLHHSGHTKGSSSFLFTVHDAKKNYQVLIANLPTIIVEKPFSTIQAYPAIAKDYAYTLTSMKNLKFDIWLAAHASQFNLHQKHRQETVYTPEVFIDQPGYEAAIASLQKQYDEHMKKQ